MQEIKCPKCGEVFAVDESGYAQIVKQVRDKEFEKELNRRKEIEIENQLARQKEEHNQQLERKREEIQEKEKEIEKLKLEIVKTESKNELDKTKRLEEKDKEIDILKAKIENYERRYETEKENSVLKATNKMRDEIIQLKGKLSVAESEQKMKENSLKQSYEDRLKQKEDEIERWRDFRLKQSTKMIGENLEQHCMTQFNSIRMTAFPNAFFEKDNDIRTGSKGDFIFRESKDDMEFISIMFEMKNEADTTATKHKNEDFFKELDKDRREKKCEYAVLVSLLEQDNDLYSGITDVSYRYKKMYVIRPQFFLPIISLLRNASLNSLEYRQELERVRNQQIDITHFEENMNTFKEGFSRNYRIASEKFSIAIDEIDKTISHLQKTKDALLASENQLRLANNKAEDLSIKKLTKNAPSIRKMFEEEK